jgi:hypothetical protein
MRRLRVSFVTGWLSAVGAAASVHGCAQQQGEPILFGTDGATDGQVDAMRRRDAGGDATMMMIGHDSGPRDSGKDTTFGFDGYVPPNKDSGHDAPHDGHADAADAHPHDAGHDTGFDAPMDAPRDAGFLVYFGPPGSPCPKLGDIQLESCGICGTQTSTCIVRPDGGVLYDAGPDTGHDASPPPDSGHVMRDSGTDLVWSTFTACTKEIDGGCLPGTAMEAGCGLCGTQLLVCEPDCEWGATNCAGQVPHGCVPGATTFDISAACEADGGAVDAPVHDGDAPDTGTRDAAHDTSSHERDAAHDTGSHRDAGSRDAGSRDAGSRDAGGRDASSDVRASDTGSHDAAHADAHDSGPMASPPISGTAQVCANTCLWSAPSACEMPPSSLTIATQPTGKVSTIVNFSATQETSRLLLGGCPTTLQALQTPYGFVTVNNSSATKPAVVSAWSWQVPGAIAVSTYITAYKTTPTTPTEFEHCINTISESCFDSSDPTACQGNYGGLMLSEGNQLKIPAGGSIVIYVQDQRNYPVDIGPVEVTIRTEGFE